MIVNWILKPHFTYMCNLKYSFCKIFNMNGFNLGYNYNSFDHIYISILTEICFIVVVLLLVQPFRLCFI